MLKRFIRYLYEYESGRRMRNVGFVKVDQSDDECIVHIHGKGLRLEGEKELTIYLFYEKEKECIGLPQGTVENVNPAVNYQLRYTKEDVGEPCNYDLIEGIIMENSSHRKYAAVWDDMPVNVNEMRLWTPADLSQGTEPENMPGEMPEDIPEEMPEVMPEVSEEPDAPNMDMDYDMPEQVQEEEGPSGGMPAEPERGGAARNFPGEETDVSEMEAVGEEAAESGSIEESEAVAEFTRFVQVEALEETEVTETECRTRTACSPCREAEPVRPEPNCQKQSKKCTKIQRQDIVHLPRCEWRLSNNSFLLHGYYNYHHLVIIEEDGNIWLGVPGIYHPKEAKAAEAFGFPQFIKAEKLNIDLDENERNDGEEFGYWCRHIRR